VTGQAKEFDVCRIKFRTAVFSLVDVIANDAASGSATLTSVAACPL
jgi:hypothetical protein